MIFPLIIRANYSKIWKNLNLGWDICRKGFKWSIGNRKDIKVWHDRWMLNNKSLREIICEPLNRTDKNQKIHEILNHSSIWQWKRIWAPLPPDLKQSIGILYTPFSQIKDKASLSLNPSGILTTKRAYQFIKNNFEQNHKKPSLLNGFGTYTAQIR